jgi:hypothetical protein
LENTKLRKELRAQYKEREVIGGVFAIVNTKNNRMLIKAVTDLQGSKNLYDFSQKTGSCVEPKLQRDWSNQGGGQFVFEVLEELKKGESQTDEEFKADVSFLLEMWVEKLSDRDMY